LDKNVRLFLIIFGHGRNLWQEKLVPALREFISDFLEETEVVLLNFLISILLFDFFLFLDFLLLFIKGFGIFFVEVLLNEIVVALCGFYKLVDAWN